MADHVRFVHTKDGRVVPEDLVAANVFPPDAENVAVDPGPVPALDSPIRAEWDESRLGDTTSEPATVRRPTRGRPRK